ncbi:translation initiation factor eIF-2B subunit beta isoform X2 [Agrilus planipennis]|uniref:Translation initiation factor eIF2B subunit beta n=1 Tax=Agrilus planipennis TaxID=224129 RepID=A0A1W4XJE5_AGRPL|nr:translation initiation factor eIF-2B subunit beta isoform X2 [Agrilus planipennis]
MLMHPNLEKSDKLVDTKKKKINKMIDKKASVKDLKQSEDNNMATKNRADDILDLINDFRHNKFKSSHEVAIKTEILMEKLISQGQWTTAQELMDLIRNRIRIFSNALPEETTPVNIMRHILKVIREEYLDFKSKVEEQQSLQYLVMANPEDHAGDYTKPQERLRSALLNNLTEYKTELETSVDNIASQALEHIHSNEIILTFGKSNTVEQFLKSAAKDRQFQVIVVEAAPNYKGHLMASNLAKCNIQTTIIPDSAVFAMMSRVNKVIIGTHAVMANGGLQAACGAHTIALAAKHYSVPVMVLVHLYKLSPLYLCSYEQNAFSVCQSPASVLPQRNGPIVSQVHVYNPVFDYVPPELVTIFVTHQGGNASSYIYRLLSELYHPDDQDL